MSVKRTRTASSNHLLTMKRLVLVQLVLVLQGALAFAPFLHGSSHPDATQLQMAKRKNLSFAEKRKRRAKQPLPVTGAPVNFNKPIDQEKEETPAETGDTPTIQRGKQLLQAQRKSVDMLTLVRERVDALDYNDIQRRLLSDGYFVVDGFLDNSTTVNELQKEGLNLLKANNMEVDLEHLGSGEYVCKIEGGVEQYKACPRSVELVVSMAKHLSPRFENLDASVCIAWMRTYDRKARLASLKLLTGEEDASLERPMDIVAKLENDSRKISVLYYPISDEWQAEGGVTFENGETIPAKRDRLILLKSETCMHRKEPWKGKDALEYASCIELHLVKSSL